MKQTAVEWLKSMVKDMINNGGDADLHAVLWHIEQAKEMERMQLAEARAEAAINAIQGIVDEYNETING